MNISHSNNPKNKTLDYIILGPGFFFITSTTIEYYLQLIDAYFSDFYC